MKLPIVGGAASIEPMIDRSDETLPEPSEMEAGPGGVEVTLGQAPVFVLPSG